VMWMGVYPESFMAPMRADVEALLARIERAAPEGDARRTAGRPAPAAHAPAGHAPAAKAEEAHH